MKAHPKFSLSGGFSHLRLQDNNLSSPVSQLDILCQPINMDQAATCLSKNHHHHLKRKKNISTQHKANPINLKFPSTALHGGATMPATAFHPSMSFSRPGPNSVQQSSNTLTSKPRTLHDHPLYKPTHSKISLQFKEKILCLEIMGVDSGRALAQNPSLRTASLHSIHSIVTFLQSKGIHSKDLGRIFGMCPKILTSDINNDLIPVFDFLSYDLRVPDVDFRKVINKCPGLLVSSVRYQLKPALFYLNRLGFKDLHSLAYQDPILLVSSVDKTIIPKLDYLVGLGFSKNDAVGMVLRCPALFTFSIENNFKPKFEYFVEEMEGRLEELKEFPQYFAFSLEKRIKLRHMEVVQCGAKVPLPLMLKSTDAEFKELLIRQGSG